MKVGYQWRGIFAGCVAVTLLVGCAADQRWRSSMEKGHEALRAGQYARAEEEFSKARDEAKTIEPKRKQLANN